VPAAKTLKEQVIDRSFRSRRHRELLAGPVVEWPTLALLQARYAAADHELERRAIGVEFERAVRELDNDESERATREAAECELQGFFDEIVEVDPDEDAATADREMTVVWCRDLRRSGLTYCAIGEQLGFSGAQVRRMILRLERERARSTDVADVAARALTRSA
jgi:hypothetical protein